MQPICFHVEVRKMILWIPISPRAMNVMKDDPEELCRISELCILHMFKDIFSSDVIQLSCIASFLFRLCYMSPKYHTYRTCPIIPYLPCVLGHLTYLPYLSYNTVFTLCIGTPYLLTILVLKYHIYSMYWDTLPTYHTCPIIPYLPCVLGHLIYLPYLS